MALNWEFLEQEVVRHLQALIRIDTTNPPGNETSADEEAAGHAGIGWLVGHHPELLEAECAIREPGPCGAGAIPGSNGRVRVSAARQLN